MHGCSTAVGHSPSNKSSKPKLLSNAAWAVMKQHFHQRLHSALNYQTPFQLGRACAQPTVVHFFEGSPRCSAARLNSAVRCTVGLVAIKARGWSVKAITELLSDEQDEASVRKILPKVEELITKDEEIEYIAVQKKLVLNLSPDAIVLTNKRFILVQPSLMGMKFRDFPWRDVENVHMSEQLIGATLTCTTIKGHFASLDSVPKKQARRVYSYAQHIEEQAYEMRRQVELEKMRAAAGGVVVHAPVAAPVIPPPMPVQKNSGDDPMAALLQLKRLREADLITDEEFSEKKSEVLSRL